MRWPGWVVAVSTTTETGQRLAKETDCAESPVFYLPLDFRFGGAAVSAGAAAEDAGADGERALAAAD